MGNYDMIQAGKISKNNQFIEIMPFGYFPINNKNGYKRWDTNKIEHDTNGYERQNPNNIKHDINWVELPKFPHSNMSIKPKAMDQRNRCTYNSSS